jgi:DNA invertase Pin-like site-specific DNA recombinase
MSKRALIYCRVSQDRDGRGRSVNEQETECRATCEREGWNVIEALTDNDVGASRHSKGDRPAWAEVARRIASGDVDVLVMWESSRGGRDLGMYVELRALLVEHGVLVNHSGRTIDLNDSGDRMMSGIEAVFAEHEADLTSARIRRATAAQALAGKPHGRRLFGYRRTYDDNTGRLIGQEPDKAEALVVQRIFRDYLAGKGTRTMARELNAEGITTGTGVKWADTQINRVLLNPAYIAKRVHKGEIVGDAIWPAIVDQGTFSRATLRRSANLTNKERITGTPRLLTHVGRCGVCGAKLKAIHDRKKRKVYACGAKYEVTRDGAKLDALIGGLVVERLSGSDAGRMLKADPTTPARSVEAHTEADTLRGRLDDAATRFALGEISSMMLAKIEQQLTPQIEALDREARAVPGLDIDVPAVGLGEWWEGLEPGVRREIVNTLFRAVVVNPVGKGQRVFQPSAIAVEWAA